MRQDESVGQLFQSISTSKSKKTKDASIKKSLKVKKQSSTVGDITFTSSSDESDKPNKKKKVNDDKIPDTQTMVGQLQKLDFSPSQLENVLKANRKVRGKLSLKRKGHHDLGHSSYHKISMSSKNDFVDSDRVMSNETCLSLQLIEEDVNSGSKLHTCASLQETEDKLNTAVSYEETNEEWKAIDLTDSQVKNLEKLEEDATSVVQPLVIEEPQSNENIEFISEFVSGSYEGPCILAESIKQEFISASDLEAYNKNADDKNKLVLVQEKISNVYNIHKVHGKEQLEEFLKGVHRNRYR